jgi:hypothetical protein
MTPQLWIDRGTAPLKRNTPRAKMVLIRILKEENHDKSFIRLPRQHISMLGKYTVGRLENVDIARFSKVYQLGCCTLYSSFTAES